MRGDDGGLSSGSETGSASGAGDGGGGGGGNGAVASQRAGKSACSSEGAAEEDPSYGDPPGSGGSGGSPHELSLEDIQVRPASAVARGSGPGTHASGCRVRSRVQSGVLLYMSLQHGPYL